VQTAVGDELVGRVLEGRYRVIERIARGGMSTVYRALDERLDREVAVKVMSAALSTDPAFADRFAREARVAARLSHLNAVSVYDQGTDGAHVFLVMELVRGRTLRDLMRERGAVSPAQAVSIMEPMLGALAAAHRAGLVHRDVKPENILLADDGAVKVADFGLARAVESDASSTRTGLMMGTVAYCPPEQIARGVADTRSDVYAAGVVLFELLTGRAPYIGDSAMAVAYQHVNSDVPPPSSLRADVPPQLDDLVLRATRREPASRPLDAGAFLAELHDVRLDLGLPVVAVPPRRVSRPDSDDTQVIGSPIQGNPHSPIEHPMPGPVAGNPMVAAAVNADATTAPTFAEAGVHRTVISDSRPPGPVAGATARQPKQRKPISRRRRARRRTAIAVIIILLLGLLTGYGAWWFAVGRYHQVPDLAGMSRSAATSKLVSGGFSVNPAVEQSFEENTATFPAGTVVTTVPGPHAHVLKGKSVQLVISKGQERYVVPAVVGKTYAQAQAALAAMPVQLQRNDAADGTGRVPAGSVIRIDPAPGTKVKRDQTINLYVSTGPPILNVPDVRNKPQDQASNALTKAGFKVNQLQDYSDTVPQGSVISQSPDAGSSQPKFTTVTIVVSKGPSLVTIPQISNGTDADQAKATLEGLGLQVKINRQFGGLLNKVVAMDPKAGTQVPKGTKVTLTVV
jgi:serine/threonine-protein kinase